VATVGYVGCRQVLCGLRLEGETMSNEQQATADDPSGDGWRDVEPDEILRHGDLFWNVDHWQATQHVGQPAVDDRTYRRRIEQLQPSDSETETIEDLRRQLAACEMLLAEAGGSGEQVNAELQQLREQVSTLTRERDRYRNQLEGAIEHSKAPEAQAQLVDRLQRWLRPVVKVVSDHPNHTSILAVSVLEFLPQIASRLIEE
jgi:hypothetical protein